MDKKLKQEIESYQDEVKNAVNNLIEVLSDKINELEILNDEQADDITKLQDEVKELQVEVDRLVAEHS